MSYEQTFLFENPLIETFCIADLFTSSEEDLKQKVDERWDLNSAVEVRGSIPLDTLHLPKD